MPSAHPFLVDQTPFLRAATVPRPAHSRNPSTSSASTYSTISSASSIITATTSDSPTITNRGISTFTSSLPPPSCNRGTHRPSPTYNPALQGSPSRSAAIEIDRNCIQWMRHTDEVEHLFGSVASRGSRLSQDERDIRRELGELLVAADKEEGEEVLVDEKKGRKGFRKWF